MHLINSKEERKTGTKTKENTSDRIFLMDHYKNILTDVGLGDVDGGGDGRITLASYLLSPS